MERDDVLIIGMPPINDEVQNRTIKELDRHYNLYTKSLRLAYLSIYEKLKDDKVWMSEVASNDGAHPQNKGYKLLADFIKTWDGWWFKN